MDGKNTKRGGRRRYKKAAPAFATNSVSPRRPSPSIKITSQEWLTAIVDATQVVTPVERSSSSFSSSTYSHKELASSLHYLNVLESVLEPLSSEWDDPPTMSPPRFHPSSLQQQQHHRGSSSVHPNNEIRVSMTSNQGGRRRNSSNYHQQYPYDYSSSPLPSSLSSSPFAENSVPTSTTWGQQLGKSNVAAASSSSFSYSNISSNRYATLQNDISSSDDDDDEEEDSTRSDDDNSNVILDDDDDYDLTTPMVTPSPSTTTTTTTTTTTAEATTTNNRDQRHALSLSMRRIMIRIVTAQSEVIACQASYAAPPQWQYGADLYQASLYKLQYALSLADSECAMWLQYEESEDNNDGNIPAFLQQDATIVEVAIQYLTNQTMSFRQRAVKKEEQLLRRLEPQWEARNAIRSKLGEDRWRNNPHPRRNYASIRAADEEQLRQIQDALQSLDDLDTDGLVESSQHLKAKVMSSSSSSSSKRRNKKNKTKSNKEKQHEKQRNNGKRPTDLSKRLPFSEYPDPTELGWTFTGSVDNVVEFFERDGVKLDWYFTTGTVKTSMFHPTQQKRTQLFGARVMPNEYLEILLNPRTHTNNRYHSHRDRDNNPNNSGGGRRRSNRRGNRGGRRGRRTQPQDERKPSRIMWE